ncbi:MAG: NADP-dependent oxidoreductase [Prolixibacteraceae bacterium]
MKALKITGYGNLVNHLEFQNCPLPVVHQNDVLIEVHAASINPIDYKTVKGAARIISKLHFPAPIGFDVSGVIVDKGSTVTQFKLGDEVFARVGGDRPGTLAELIAVDASFIALKPTSVSHEEAASIPLVGLTTLQAFQMAGLKAGQKVLIHAGSGGIGSFAVQLAKNIGAEVYTTTSTKNVEWVKALGADRVFDYKTENYLDEISEVDFIYDTIGGEHTRNAFKIVKSGGAVINLTGPVIDRQSQIELGLSPLLRPVFAVMGLGIKSSIRKKKALYRFFLMEPNGAQLHQIAKLMEDGKIKAIIDSVYPFDKAIDALLYLELGHARGKVIVKVK